MMSGRPRSEDDDKRDSSAQASEARLDNLKSLTFLGKNVGAPTGMPGRMDPERM